MIDPLLGMKIGVIAALIIEEAALSHSTGFAAQLFYGRIVKEQAMYFSTTERRELP